MEGVHSLFQHAVSKFVWRSWEKSRETQNSCWNSNFIPPKYKSGGLPL